LIEAEMRGKEQLCEKPLGGLSSELTHPFKADTRRGRDMAPSAPTVFISYSHDFTEHEELVLRPTAAQRRRRRPRSIRSSAAGRRKAGDVITVTLYGLLPAAWHPSYRQNWIAFRQRAVEDLILAIPVGLRPEEGRVCNAL
jgi:hypothetical protein